MQKLKKIVPSHVQDVIEKMVYHEQEVVEAMKEQEVVEARMSKMVQIETMKEDDAMWVKKTSEDLDSTLAAQPAPKKRKASSWPGWKVKQQGAWQGF